MNHFNFLYFLCIFSYAYVLKKEFVIADSLKPWGTFPNEIQILRIVDLNPDIEIIPMKKEYL